MSDETTQDISQKYDTKPTIETVLERISDLRADLQKQFTALDVRLDRIESEVKQTRSEFLTLRADFTELKGALKEHITALR